MKNEIKKGAKLLVINLAILIGSTIVLYLFSIAILLTLFNAIFGDERVGMYALNVFIRICFSVISALVICIPYIRSTEERKAFLSVLEAKKYNRKEDAMVLIKTKAFYVECAVFILVNLIMFLLKNPPAWIFMLGTLILPFNLWQDVGTLLMVNPPQWVFLVAILVFPIFNLWLRTEIHKKWASERLHFANPS